MNQMKRKTFLLTLGLTGLSVYIYKRIRRFKLSSDESLESFLVGRTAETVFAPIYRLDSKDLFDNLINIANKVIPEKVPNPYFSYRYNFKEIEVDGMQVFILNNKNNKEQDVVFYLHGGGFIAQPSPPQWHLIHNIIRRTDAAIIVPIYPKAPHYTFDDAYPKLIHTYKLVLEKMKKRRSLTLMGDSAGGNLALVLSTILDEFNLEAPDRIILLSAWVDLSAKSPDIKDYENLDKLLPRLFYVEATGRLWAGKEAPDHPLVSPIYSKNLRKLPSTYMIVGGHELFYPENNKLYEKLVDLGVEVTMYVGELMSHDYVIFETPEARKARDLIEEWIKNG